MMLKGPFFSYRFSVRLCVFWALASAAMASATPMDCKPLFEGASREPSIPVAINFFKKGNSFLEREQIKVQRAKEAATEFVNQYEKGAGNDPGSPFSIRGVEIRPIEEAPGKRAFSYQDGNVIIGLKKDFMGNYKVPAPQEIRDAWERGDHFPRLSLFKANPILKVWPFLNPTGVFRQEMRATLTSLQTGARARILTAPIAELRALSRGLLDSVPDAEIEKLRGQWAEEVTKRSSADGVGSAAVRRVIQDQMPDYDLKLASRFINIGNLHDIQIGLKTGDADVINPTERPKVKVDSRGTFINVFTIDRVRVEVDLAGALERYALHQVLGSVSNRGK